MPTFDQLEIYVLSERVNLVLEENLCRYVYSFASRRKFLPMVEFAIDNSVHAAMTRTLLVVKHHCHPRALSLVEGD